MDGQTVLAMLLILGRTAENRTAGKKGDTVGFGMGSFATTAPSVGIAPTRHVGLTYSCAGVEQKGGHAV